MCVDWIRRRALKDRRDAPYEGEQEELVKR